MKTREKKLVPKKALLVTRIYPATNSPISFFESLPTIDFVPYA
jgi:hypothetical protein